MDSIFRKYVQEDSERNQQMEIELIAFVKEHGGFIDTRNIDMKLDNIYGVIYNKEDNSTYQDVKIGGIAVMDGNLCILPIEYSYQYESMTIEEMLESDDWLSIFGGLVWSNATLIAICECIEEYVQ